MIKIVQIKRRIAQAYAGEHWAILPKKAVRGDMNETAVLSFFTQHAGCGLGSEKHLSVGNNLSYRSNFVGDARGSCVWNSEQQRSLLVIGRAAMAQRVDARTRRVRDCERINE